MKNLLNDPKFSDFDKDTLAWYIEKTNLEITQEFIDLIIQYLDNGCSLEESINIAAGIIRHNL